MVKYKIIYDRSKCIGATACTKMDPSSFKMNEDNKADLISCKAEGDKSSLEIGEDLRSKADAAAKACPTSAISIERIDG